MEETLPDKDFGSNRAVPPAGKGKSATLVPHIVAVVAAVVLVAAFFLPYGSANEDYRESVAGHEDAQYVEGIDITVGDMLDISLLNYTRGNLELGDYTNSETGTQAGIGYTLYAGIYIAAAVLPAIALLFAIFKKAIPTAIFGLLTLGLTNTIHWDFADRAILPSSTHDWGIASTVYLVFSIVLIAAAIWLAVEKRREKARRA